MDETLKMVKGGAVQALWRRVLPLLCFVWSPLVSSLRRKSRSNLRTRSYAAKSRTLPQTILRRRLTPRYVYLHVCIYWQDMRLMRVCVCVDCIVVDTCYVIVAVVSCVRVTEHDGAGRQWQGRQGEGGKVGGDVDGDG